MGIYLLAVIDQRFDGNMEEAAKAAGVSTGTLNSWLRGGIKDPRVETLKKVAQGLGASYDDLCRLAVGLPPLKPLTPDEQRRQALLERIIWLINSLPEDEFERWLQDFESRWSTEWRRKRGPFVPVAIPNTLVG